MPGYRIVSAIAVLLCYFFLPVFVSDSEAGWGDFMDSGQSLGGSTSNAVALGDVDGDGDIDVFVANYDEPNKVWSYFYCYADIDADDDVDDQDLAVFADEQGHSNCESY
jgi:hypothetical protein